MIPSRVTITFANGIRANFRDQVLRDAFDGDHRLVAPGTQLQRDCQSGLPGPRHRPLPEAIDRAVPSWLHTADPSIPVQNNMS